jgi:hypothetical protein
VNFVAHAYVASMSVVRERPEDAVWPPAPAALAFGSMLPDLASMAGVRLFAADLPDPVGVGVRLHHRTDQAFHSDAAFRQGVARMRTVLGEAGLAKGPRRAVAHAGYEMLLDGHILGWQGGEAAFSSLLEAAVELSPALPRGLDDSIGRLVASMHRDRWWLRYGDPADVAYALWRRLGARPLLAFPASDLPVVAGALAEAHEAIGTNAHPLVGRLLASLDDDPSAAIFAAPS